MMQTQNGRFQRGKCSNQGCGARKVRLCCGVPCAVLGVVWCLFLLLNSTFSQSDDDHPCMLFAPCSSTIVTHISMFYKLGPLSRRSIVEFLFCLWSRLHNRSLISNVVFILVLLF